VEVVEEQLEPCVKADQQRVRNPREWRVKPPREEFFSWMSNPCAVIDLVSLSILLSGGSMKAFPCKRSIPKLSQEDDCCETVANLSQSKEFYTNYVFLN
jgi:hypothetical protein